MQFLPRSWEPLWGKEDERPLALGHFADSMIPLHGYQLSVDLRSSNEFWLGGQVELRINSHRDSSSILPMESISQKTFGIKMAETGTVDVPASTLDELFEREKISHIDLMKVDIQGAERLMIEGAEAALAK